MKQLMIHEILELVSAEKDKSKKIQILRKHSSPSLRTILQYALDPKVTFYTKKWPKFVLEDRIQHLSFNSLHYEYKRLYIFLSENLEKIISGKSGIKPERKTQILLEMIDNLHPKESQVLLWILSKQFTKYTEITKTLAEEAFPDLFK